MLHRLLCRSITTWGRLRALDAAGQIDLSADRADLLQRAGARAKVLEAALATWRVGRGLPVDRATLIDSGAITPRFVDEVAAIAAEVDGDAQCLIAALDDASPLDPESA